MSIFEVYLYLYLFYLNQWDKYTVDSWKIYRQRDYIMKNISYEHNKLNYKYLGITYIHIIFSKWNISTPQGIEPFRILGECASITQPNI